MNDDSPETGRLGHNIIAGQIAGQLRALVERIERLEEERRTIGEDVKGVYVEAKAHGFDGKVLRKVVQIRRQDQEARRAQDETLHLYLSALGMES
jgi:uncharacterized protein (UPF0335 family)